MNNQRPVQLSGSQGDSRWRRHRDEFIMHLQRRGFSPRTMGTYADCLRRFGRWIAQSGVGDMLAMTAKDLEAFQIWLSEEGEGRYSLGYKANFVKAVRGLFKFLAAERKILVDPARRLRYPRREHRLCRHLLREDELRRLLRAPVETRKQLRDSAAVSIVAMSGPRVSELASIDVDDVNLHEREIVIRKGKGGKSRLVFFDPETRSRLAKYLVYARPALSAKGEKALIVGDTGRRMSRSRLEVLVKRRAKAAELAKPVTPHGLRHTLCTLLLKHGANIRVIGELAGHAKMDTTAAYTKMDIGELAKVYRQAHPKGEA